MLSNLLKTLSFGATIQSDGKPYSVVLRLSDRLFIVVEPGQKMPAPLMLCQADIQMQQPGQDAMSGPTPTPDKDKELDKKDPEINPGKKELPSEKDEEKV